MRFHAVLCISVAFFATSRSAAASTSDSPTIAAIEADDNKPKTADPLEGEKPAPKPSAAKGAVGTWELEYENMGTLITDRYEIKAADSGDLTGNLVRDGKVVTKLENIKIDGDKVTFEAKGTTDGTDWSVDFSGTVTGDDIDGMVKIKVNDQTFDLPWKPKRVKDTK